MFIYKIRIDRDDSRPGLNERPKDLSTAIAQITVDFNYVLKPISSNNSRAMGTLLPNELERQTLVETENEYQKKIAIDLEAGIG